MRTARESCYAAVGDHLARRELTRGTAQVASAMLDMMTGHMEPRRLQVSVAAIAERAGVTERQVVKATTELDRLGFLDKRSARVVPKPNPAYDPRQPAGPANPPKVLRREHVTSYAWRTNCIRRAGRRGFRFLRGLPLPPRRTTGTARPVIPVKNLPHGATTGSPPGVWASSTPVDDPIDAVRGVRPPLPPNWSSLTFAERARWYSEVGSDR